MIIAQEFNAGIHMLKCYPPTSARFAETIKQFFPDEPTLMLCLGLGNIQAAISYLTGMCETLRLSNAPEIVVTRSPEENYDAAWLEIMAKEALHLCKEYAKENAPIPRWRKWAEWFS